MSRLSRILCSVASAALLILPSMATAETSIPPSIATPDSIETRIGTLEFKDGAPSAETIGKVYENLLFTHAFNAFVNTFQGVSMAAIRNGMLAVGIKDNEFIIFSELMDAKSLFLTANADTVYYFTFVDLTAGPMVFESPPGALGVIDDMWWRWVTDFGAPGPDRGEGGRYLLVPPGYDGPLPEGGFYVARARTNYVAVLGRSFMKEDDPKPTVEIVKSKTKLYPYEAGGVGTSIAKFLEGDIMLGRLNEPPATVWHEGTGLVMNTVPPNDYSFFEVLNEVVQQEPATSLDPELMGSIAAIGIVKGKPFAPDEQTKAILTESVALANATARTLIMNPQEESWRYYPGSAWMNSLFIGGYLFETPIPEITREGAKPFPPTGHRTLDIRTSFFYLATGVTPAMSMRLEGVGSQYLWATLDGNGDYFDGGKTYKVTLPKDIPEANFWSFTLYDNQSRSMLDTPQRYPRAGSQSYPSPAAEAAADGTTTVWFGPVQPAGVARGNWIQTVPGRGWFVILRLYSPLERFFTKEWRPSEIELVQ